MKNKEFLRGYESYKPYLDVYACNPYKQVNVIKNEANGVIQAYQPESVPFFNGWEAARRENEKLDGYFLFLDDFRFPNWINYIKYPESASWIIARTYYEFLDTIKENGMPKLISFDFDLDLHQLGDISHFGPYLTGLDCSNWLINHCKTNDIAPPMVAVHSQNPEGNKKITENLNNLFK
jgi:hypothetical protein